MSASRVACITQAECVGCALCIEACPFDAIAGLAQKAHRVLPDLCTECGLCLPACPVDCISLQPAPTHPPRNRSYRLRARDRARQRLQRLAMLRDAHDRQVQAAHARFRGESSEARQAAIRDAVGRALGRTAPPR